MPRIRRSLVLAACAVASAAQSEYTILNNTDFNPCADAQRVGNCGYDYNVTCDPATIEALCSATCWCNSVNINGWMKPVTCNVAVPSPGVTTFIRKVAPTPSPEAPIPPIDDVHYPPEEVRGWASP